VRTVQNPDALSQSLEQAFCLSTKQFAALGTIHSEFPFRKIERAGASTDERKLKTDAEKSRKAKKRA
jgi:hypothetical protein